MGKTKKIKFNKVLKLDAKTEATEDIVLSLIKQRLTSDLASYYQENEDAYYNEWEIDKQEEKGNNKPDNRIKNNFAKYIVRVSKAYFVGKPITYTSNNKELTAWIEQNKLVVLDGELTEKASIYGHAFELMYLNREAKVRSKAIDPMNIIYAFENTVEADELFAIYFYTTEDLEGELTGYEGRVYTGEKYQSFKANKDLQSLEFIEEVSHPFGNIPIIEWKENTSRIGAFDDVESSINAYNKAISEKGNDVDTFADAYMKLIGVPLDDESLKFIRENRIINLKQLPSGSVPPDIDFLQKPNGDGTQEHFLDRIDENIHNLACVPNLSDKNFGQNNSGIRLEYKMWVSDSVRSDKEQMFRSGEKKRFKMAAKALNFKKGIIKRVLDTVTRVNKETSSVEDLVSFTFHKNTPVSSYEMAKMVKELDGIISKRTQLRLLPFINDVDEELDFIKEEEEEVDDDFTDPHGIEGDGDGSEE